MKIVLSIGLGVKTETQKMPQVESCHFCVPCAHNYTSPREHMNRNFMNPGISSRKGYGSRLIPAMKEISDLGNSCSLSDFSFHVENKMNSKPLPALQI